MALTIAERPDSREWSGGQCTFAYLIEGVGGDDDMAVRDLVLATAPATYHWLFRDPDIAIEPREVDETTSHGIWYAAVRYTPANLQQLEVDSIRISGSTGGATQHLTQSYQTRASYPSGTAENFNGAIGVSGTGPDATVEGVDVVAPNGQLSITKVWRVSSLPDVRTLYGLTGRVNDFAITVTDTVTRMSITFQPGEFLLINVEWGNVRADGGIEFTYQVGWSLNATGLTAGTITGISKYGHDWLWTRYKTVKGEAAAVKTQADAHVEQVYRGADMSILGLSG